MSEELQNDPLLEEYSYDSMFGPAEVFCIETDGGVPLRVLYVDGGFQSATFLGENRFLAPFAYCRAFDVMFQREPSPKRILLLGGGAFSYPKHALTQRQGVSMDVVEIDPAVIEIARKHFFLDELEQRCGNRLRSFAADGAAFLKDALPASYDAIVNDCFAGTVQDAPLLSPENLMLSKSVLVSGGQYLLNAVFDEEDEAAEQIAAEQVQQALEDAFKFVCHRAVEDEDYAGCINHVYVASDQEIAW